MTDATAAAELPAIERTLELKASPQRVWRAITDADELAKWFPQRATWDLRPGGQGTFYWDGHGDFPIRVERVDPPRYLAWSWGLEAEQDLESAHNVTLVEWWLEATEDGGTRLRLRESGFRRPEHRSENEQGWTEELAELIELVDGTPVSER
jgi:uncharacterized protein YndB with AHSA1/START domain